MKLLFKKEFQIILGLIIFAAALRIPTLGSPLIEDEAISFNRYIDVPWQKLIFFYQDTSDLNSASDFQPRSVHVNRAPMKWRG